MLFLPPTPLLATPMYILRFGPMACETLGGVPLTGETGRLEKELGGCSVGTLGRGDMRRLTLLKEVETMDGEHLKDMPAMMEPCAPGKPVCHSTYPPTVHSVETTQVVINLIFKHLCTYNECVLLELHVIYFGGNSS